MFPAPTKTVIYDHTGRDLYQFVPRSIVLQPVQDVRLADFLHKHNREKINFQYDIILLMLGAHDVNELGRAELYYYFRSIIQVVKFLNPAAHIILSTPVPHAAESTQIPRIFSQRKAGHKSTILLCEKGMLLY